ncbi:hypothetical protein [Modestobacter sp. SSW1-42]|uniref:hypothetical protein n=1 Tax=Modestobacter sp. SSW1-42 TaxID=596372 RepID=UPI003987A9C2
MRSDGGSRAVEEESSLRLVVRAGAAIVVVTVACLPYVVAVATEAARAAGQRLRHPLEEADAQPDVRLSVLDGRGRLR